MTKKSKQNKTLKDNTKNNQRKKTSKRKISEDVNSIDDVLKESKPLAKKKKR